MTQLRELENNHHEKVSELALQYLENAIKGSLEEEPPEQLRKCVCVCVWGGGGGGVIHYIVWDQL